MIGVTTRSTSRSHGADVDTLAAALYVRIDGRLGERSTLRPRRRPGGDRSEVERRELLTLAVLQALGVSTRTPAGCATPDP